MNVGIIGAGKLGFPVAVAMGYRGNNVFVYDKNPDIEHYCREPYSYPHLEQGFNGKLFPELIHKHPPTVCVSLLALVESVDLIFVAIQTPHEEKYDGAHVIPEDRCDFNYEYLVQSITELMEVVRPHQTVVIISTCIPGAIRREVLPLTAGKCNVVYNPFFIAMGTVVRDFLNPEFVLIGLEEKTDLERFRSLYNFYKKTLLNAPDWKTEKYYRVMSIESAELTKVAYNTFIGFKIGLANTFGLLCDRIDFADADDVMNSLKQATDRLVSTAYLDPGMGDGGGCHPRDLIAMSHMHAGYFTGWNPFDDVMRWREQHARILANLMVANNNGLPYAIYGTAFKAGTGMEDGSHAILVYRIMTDEMGLEVELYDPYVPRGQHDPETPKMILIGCNHNVWITQQIARGSIVLDPFRIGEPNGTFEYIPIGAGANIREPRHTPPEPSVYAKHHISVGNNPDGSEKH